MVLYIRPISFIVRRFYFVRCLQMSLLDEGEMNENPFEALGDDAVAVLLQSAHDEEESLLVYGVTQDDFGHRRRRQVLSSGGTVRCISARTAGELVVLDCHRVGCHFHVFEEWVVAHYKVICIQVHVHMTRTQSILIKKIYNQQYNFIVQ